MEPYGITGIINLSSSFSLDGVKGMIQDLYYKIKALRKEYGEFSISIGGGNCSTYNERSGCELEYMNISAQAEYKMNTNLDSQEKIDEWKTYTGQVATGTK